MNLLYIAVITPLVIGFSFEMTAELNLMELLSLFISSAWILGNFRTQVLIKGVPTLKFQTLLKHYQANGLVYDILGVIPLNILLGQGPVAQDGGIFSVFGRVTGLSLYALLRSVRIFSSWRALQLFGKAEVSFKNNQFNIIMQILKAFFYIFFLGHFLACFWYFTVANLENAATGTKEKVKTWIDYHSLASEPGSVQYLRSIYTIFNIVCSVGYGDMFPMTDIERIFFTAMITLGDLLFALAFGLITQITLQISLTNETKQFKDKMYQIQEFMNSFNLDQAQQRRVEQYFAYEYQQKYNSNLLVYYDLIGYLPYQLREEVIYQSSKGLLTSMFSKYRSENLIRKLACVLESVIFLPGDYIVYKEDIGNEMYFIAEGSVYVLADDKQTVITSLGKGCYFGEIALLLKTKRTSYVQAETFCIINILKKDDFDNIARNFPEIEKQLQERAAQRIEEIKLLEDESGDSEGPVGISGMNILSQDELMHFHEDHIDPSMSAARESRQTRETRKKQPQHGDRSNNSTSKQAKKSNQPKDPTQLRQVKEKKPEARQDGFQSSNIIQEERSSQFDSSSCGSHQTDLADPKQDEKEQTASQLRNPTTAMQPFPIEQQNIEQISQAINAIPDAIRHMSNTSQSSVNNHNASNQPALNPAQQAANQPHHGHNPRPEQPFAQSPSQNQHQANHSAYPLNINIQNNYNIVVDRQGNQQQAMNTNDNPSLQDDIPPPEIAEAARSNTRAGQDEVLEEMLADMSIGRASEAKSDGSKEAKMDVDDGGPTHPEPKQPPAIEISAVRRDTGTAPATQSHVVEAQIEKEEAKKPQPNHSESDEDAEEKRDVVTDATLPNKQIFLDLQAANQQSLERQRRDSRDPLEEFFSPTNAKDRPELSSRQQEEKLSRTRYMESFNSSGEDHDGSKSFSQMSNLALGRSNAARKPPRKEPFAPVGRSTSSVLDGFYKPTSELNTNLTHLLSQQSQKRTGEQKADPKSSKSSASGRRGDANADPDVNKDRKLSQAHQSSLNISRRGSRALHRANSSQLPISAGTKAPEARDGRDRHISQVVSKQDLARPRRGQSELTVSGTGASASQPRASTTNEAGARKFGSQADVGSLAKGFGSTKRRNSMHEGFSLQQSAVQQFMKQADGTAGTKLSVTNIFKDHKQQDINHSIRRIGTTTGPSPLGHQGDPRGTTHRPMRRLSRISLGKNLTLSQTAGLKLQWTIT